MIKNKKQNGFTLIELIIVVAIIGILSAIAYPSYQEHIKTSRRVDATAALMGLMNAMERHFTETSSYQKAAKNNADTGKPAIFSETSPLDGKTAYYDLTIHKATRTTYTLRATPISTSAQKNNGFLEINHTQSKGSWDKNNNGSIGNDEKTWG
ncbi:MAG: type IV pilin protein [Methylococcales bacterium]|nr:type IV pilin protein [Methylococcales bacterium]MCK5924879.1 type IV pilin protein [Methylococcales bacterium]